MTHDKHGELSGKTGSAESSLATARLAEQVFVNQVTDCLDASCAAMDAATLSRLNTMRHQALDGRQALRISREFRPRLLLPFGTLASGCGLLLVLAVLNQPVVPTPGAAPEPSLADINLLTTQEELAFYEDYEFIQWLADTESGF